MDVKVKKNVGPQGYADVRKLKNSIRVTFKTGDAYELEDLSQLDKDFVAGEYNVSLSSDCTKIFGLRPTAGSYVMEFVEVPDNRAGVKDTKIQRGRMVVTENQKYMIPDQMVWPVVVKVVADGHRFDGLTMYSQLPYLFTNVPGSNETMISGTKKQVERLETFLRVNGMDLSEISIPYGPPTALLSWIDKYLKENGKPFFGTIDDKGWVKEVAELPAQLATPAKKKKSK